MNSSLVFLLAFAIGLVTGLRSLTGPALVCWAAHLGWLNLEGSRLEFMQSTLATYGFSALALRELCQIFLEESPKLLQKLRQAIADAEPEAVMRAAHSLKGELGYLGAARASQAAQELEDMGHENNLSQAPETFVVLEREMATLHLALKDPEGAIQ